jgi:hypothetical protein
MKALTMIVALTLSAASLFGGTKEKTKPNFILVIEDRIIKVCDEKGEDLTRIHLNGFRMLYVGQPTLFPPYTQDAFRHFVLDAIAAWRVGYGKREAIVSPDYQVVTYDEATGPNDPFTLTVEQGFGFFILRDSLKSCGDTCQGERYRAEIVMVSREQMAKAQRAMDKMYPTISTKEEYDALPNSTLFRDATDGEIYSKRTAPTPAPTPAPYVNI